MNAPLPLMSEEEVLRCRIHGDEPGLGALRTPRGLLPLAAVAVRTRIVGLFAHTTVEQTFVNAHAEPLEATYIFPLPDRAAVTRFTLAVNGRVVDGVLQERGEARRTYDTAIQQGHRASIAEEERPGVFTMRVGNILPGEDWEKAIKKELSSSDLVLVLVKSHQTSRVACGLARFGLIPSWAKTTRSYATRTSLAVKQSQKKPAIATLGGDVSSDWCCAHWLPSSELTGERVGEQILFQTQRLQICRWITTFEFPPVLQIRAATFPIPREGSLMTRARSALLPGLSASRKYESTSFTSFRSKNFVPSSWYGTSKLRNASSIPRDWKLVRYKTAIEVDDLPTVALMREHKDRIGAVIVSMAIASFFSAKRASAV